MKSLPYFISGLALALCLSACSQAPSDQVEITPAAEQSAQAAPVPQVEVPPTTMIHANPATLPSCNAGSVTIEWDIRKAHPTLSTVKIYTGGGKLFAHSGASGSMATGPWAKPGAIFILKSGTDDTELEQLVIGGPVCGQ